MTITPDQADQWAQEATDGPWEAKSYPHEGIVIWGEDGGLVESDADLALVAAAPELAQTIAGMGWQWGVEKYDGHRWSRHGGWVGPESIARPRLRKAREDGETARLVRRLVGPVEVVE